MTIEKSLLALQDTMLNALTSDAPLAKTMYMLCSEVERLAPEVHCCVIRLDGQCMRPLAAPSMPDNYNQALDGFAIGPHVGACGVSMTYGRSVMTTDIATDPNWAALRHLVMPLGLGVCWSHPIKARDGKVLGSMAFYYPPGGRPTEFHHKLAENCVNLCSLAFEHEASQRSLQRHVFFDDLTGLPNRAMLNREMQRTLENGKRDGGKFSLLSIDMDNLKQINDTLGHLVGDSVLQRAADIFRSAMRNDDYVGRLGGDEFLAVVRHGSMEELQGAVVRLHQAFQSPLDLAPVREEGVQASISIGVATWPQDGGQIETLLNRANDAMYQAKSAGRGRAVFHGGAQLQAASTARASAGDVSVQMPVVAGAETATDELSLYGEKAQPPMARLSNAIKPGLRAIVDQFYTQVPTVAGASYLVSYLSDDELEHLKLGLVEHLTLLCSPDLDSARHEEFATRVGHIHIQVGLARAGLADSYSILSALVAGYVDATEHGQALTIFGQRLLRDLSWQLIAAQEQQLMQSAVLAKLGDLAWRARSYTELISSAAACIGSLKGVAGCAFLHPDSRYVFQVEAVAGDGIAEFFDEVVRVQDPESGRTFDATPAGWAWQSLVISRCFNFRTDARMTGWLPLLGKWGLRSNIAIPLIAPKEQTASSVVVVFSRLPGGFSSPEQDMFFAQTQSMLVFGISRLRAWQIASDAVPFTTRERWARLLKTSGLEMYYQPIMDLNTGRIFKVEALARLHDGGKLLAPGMFFPALSEKDFLLLYENGLSQVLRQRETWATQGLELDVAVNLPNAALEDELYVGITARIMQRFNCPPSALTLEILEADAVPQEVDLLQAIERYRALGLHMAEDDLGSGYSTLSRMREMAFDVIKIDRSILMKVEDDPYNTLCFIYQLTKLGHGLGGKVIVEGVESIDLLEASVVLGVDGAQGYAIAKPLPASELETWLRQPLALPSARAMPAAVSLLALLAHVLVWEESWLLLNEEAPESEYKQALSRSLLESRLPDDGALSPPAVAAKRELIQCAMTHGLRSAEYVQARSGMVAMLRASAKPDSSTVPPLRPVSSLGK